MKPLEIISNWVNPVFTREYWQNLAEYLGIGRRRREQPVEDAEALADFIATRASHVAQASLYGYLRTRAGTRFPQMFENPDLLTSINIAKWHVWLACVSDLCVYSGQHLAQSDAFDAERVAAVLPQTLRRVLDEAGEPDEAGPDFAAARAKVLQRIDACDWRLERDDDTVFSASPEALFYWSPIAEELKERDEPIVKNSVRYRWIEVRRSVRSQFDPAALARALDQDDA